MKPRYDRRVEAVQLRWEVQRPNGNPPVLLHSNARHLKLAAEVGVGDYDHEVGVREYDHEPEPEDREP